MANIGKPKRRITSTPKRETKPSPQRAPGREAPVEKPAKKEPART